MKKAKPAHVRASSTRESIRTAAVQLFSEKGFAATSTREICQRARVTKPVLYYHFGSKDRLYQELLVDACNESRKQLLLAAQKGKTTREKIIELLAANFAGTVRNPSLSLMFFRMIFAREKESPAIDYLEMGLDWIRLVEGIVAEGIQRGEMRGQPWEIAEVLMGIHTIYAMSYLLTGQPTLDRSLARRIVDLLLQGCGTATTRR
jgi:TetR/AcrR family transcriptional regulator